MTGAASAGAAKGRRQTTDSDVMNRRGVNWVRWVVTDELGWADREQPNSDYGVDVHFEQRGASGRCTGRMLAVQVKSGPSYFRSTAGGWHYWPEQVHVEYWLHNSLPVVFVLADPDNREAFWVHVTPETLQETRTGHRLFIPEAQKLVEALPGWTAIVDESAVLAHERYHALRKHLPELVAGRLDRVEAAQQLPSMLLGIELAAGRRTPDAVVERFVTDPPAWFQLLGWVGLTVIADFAQSHQLILPALDIYKRIVEGDSDLAPECLLRMGVLLARDDLRASETSLRLASGHGEPISLAVAAWLALRDGMTNDSLPVSPHEISRSTVRDQPLVWVHAGEHHLHGGRLDTAIELYTTLLTSVRPRMPGWALRLAEIYLARAGRPGSAATDYDAAVAWADTALTVARDALIEVEQTATGALAIFEASGSMLLASRQALDVLEDDLDLSEAARFEIATVALQAGRFARHGQAYADRVLATLPKDDPRTRRLVESLEPTTADELVKAGEQAAARGDTEETDQVVFQLALLGRDRTDLIPGAGEREERLADLARAVAGDPHALVRLRRRGLDNRIEWETLVLALKALGRWQEILDAVDRAAAAFGGPVLELYRVEALLYLGRNTEAADTANRALAAQPNADVEIRLRECLAQASYELRDLEGACRHLRLALTLAEQEGLPPRHAWDLAHFLTRLHRREDAAAVLADRNLVPTKLQEAGVWVNAQPPYRWRTDTVRLALDLVESFLDDPELVRVVLGRLFTETRGEDDEPSGDLDPRIEIENSERERLRRLLGVHLEQHPNPVLRTIKIGPDEDPLAKPRSVDRVPGLGRELSCDLVASGGRG